MRYLYTRDLPTLSQVLADLGNPSPREIANYFQVTERTVFRWMAAGVAPRPVELALFWESNYGWSAIETDLFNSRNYFLNLSESLKNDVQNLRVRVAWLEKNGSFGSANEPFLSPVRVVPGVVNA